MPRLRVGSKLRIAPKIREESEMSRHLIVTLIAAAALTGCGIRQARQAQQLAAQARDEAERQRALAQSNAERATLAVEEAGRQQAIAQENEAEANRQRQMAIASEQIAKRNEAEATRQSEIAQQLRAEAEGAQLVAENKLKAAVAEIACLKKELEQAKRGAGAKQEVQAKPSEPSGE